MTRNLYALLVGINEYPHPISRLSGCVNDILAVEEYLKERVAKDGYQLHLHKLLDQEATRQAIIEGFQQHLCQAGSEDIVLFYYSGHGSQAKTSEEFWHLEPDRLEETLICYDSRTKGGWDLADKELGYLIDKVAKNNPHISIILDCCHSGSGTKDPLLETKVRRGSIDRRERPLNSYIFQPEELETIWLPCSNPEKYRSGWNLPQGRHILLAACRDFQKAKDEINNERRGAFSYCLMETLRNNGNKLTYQDLLRQTKSLLYSYFNQQSPQLEVYSSDGENDENQLFLDGAIAERQSYFMVSYNKECNDWVIDGGAVHGIPRPSKGETTFLALFPSNCNCKDLHDPSKSVGEAEVTEVLQSLSKVEISGLENLTKERQFKAVVTRLPLPRLGIYFDGEKAGVNLARQALKSAHLGKPSIYVDEEQELTKAEFRLLCNNNQYLIVRPNDDQPLVEQIDGYRIENAEKVIRRLEHIARWQTIVKLQSPPTSSIKPGDIKMKIFSEENKELSQSNGIRLEYKYKEGKFSEPIFRLSLTNNSDKTLYCNVFDLSGLFAVKAAFFKTTLQIKPNSKPHFSGRLKNSIPKLLLKQGITEYTDIFKLIVSTEDFDAKLMEQDKLDAHREKYQTRSLYKQGTLNRFMDRVQNRDVGSASEEMYEDWYTEQVVVTTVHPLDSMASQK